MNINSNSSDGALKIKEIFILIIILVIFGTCVSLYNANTIEVATVVSDNSNTQMEIQVASISQPTVERQFDLSSRSSGERTIEEVAIEEPKVEYISIDEIEISRDMDLTQRCGISKEDFVSLMEGLRVDTSGFFAENAETIYDLCEEYELNEVFFCGLIAAESGWNISSNHRNKHNYISMMSGGSLIRYADEYDGLEAAAKLLHNKYLSEGGSCYYGTTLSCVQRRFCPNSSTWVGLVYGCMKQVLK